MASRALNKITLIGNVGEEPKLNSTNSGLLVCSFSLATNRSWVVKSTGERKEKTQWHEIVAFGKLAEICGQILTKGTKVFVLGRIQTKKFINPQNERFKKVEVVADKVDAFSKRKEKLYDR